MWVREIYKQREIGGIYHTLVQEMSLGDREFYFKKIFVFCFFVVLFFFHKSGEIP